jgi:uncharacterized protein YndB with AHSA1/START domain
MSRYRFTIHVGAVPEKVFDLWMNLDRMAEWVGGVTKVTDISGPVDQAGTRYTVWFGRMGSPTEILEVQRPSFIRSRFGNSILRGQTRVTFEPEGDGTLLTQEFQTEGLIPAIAARIFASGSYKGSFRGELAAFARIAERDALTQNGRTY